MGLISDFEGARLRRLSSQIFRKSVCVCVCVGRRGGGWTRPLKEVLFDLFAISNGGKLLAN